MPLPNAAFGMQPFGPRPGGAPPRPGSFGVPASRPPLVPPPVRPSAMPPPTMAAPRPSAPAGWPAPPATYPSYPPPPFAYPPPLPAYPAAGDAWGYADGDPHAPPTALDVWNQLLLSYLDLRNVGVSATGEAFPETTVGDVQRCVLQFSREHCLPRYDLADLGATREAWRDALARTRALCAPMAWDAIYPENERFWLSDSLALAQRLAAVDARRNAVVTSPDGVLSVLGDRSDPLTTWQDVRAFYLARRMVRRDERGWRYPDTTVGDVVQIARVLERDVRDTVAVAPPGSIAAMALRGRLSPWRPLVRDIDDAARRATLETPFAQNARFWHVTRRLALALSVARDVARGGGGTTTLGDLVTSELG